MFVTVIKSIFGLLIIIASIAFCVKSVVGLVQTVKKHKEEKKGE